MGLICAIPRATGPNEQKRSLCRPPWAEIGRAVGAGIESRFGKIAVVHRGLKARLIPAQSNALGTHAK
jgi:hypothetical protein